MSVNRDLFSTGALQARSGTLYIAPEGDILVPGTPSFYERIGYRNPDFDLGDYAVRNMGFVGIGRVAPDRLRVRLRPALVSPPAVDGICQYLAPQQGAEIEVEFFEDDWQTEIWPNDESLPRRFAALCRPRDGGPGGSGGGPSFDLRPMEITRATEDYSNPLKPLFQKWRTSFGTFDETTMPFLARFGFLARLVITTLPDPAAAPRFSFIGSNVRVYDEQTMLELIGMPVDQQPDRKYGEWISAQYKSIVETNRPRLDSVRASIKQTTAKQLHCLGYDRLLLPWRSRNGLPVITCATVQTSDHWAATNDNAESAGPPLSDRPADRDALAACPGAGTA